MIIQTKLYCFRETRFFVGKIENFDELQLPQSSIFLAETSHTFPTNQCLQKGVRNFELFAKIKKTWFLHTCFLHFLLITQDFC